MPGSDTPGPATDARGRVVIDPTVLTTELMQRELANVRRDLEARQETRQREHASLQELMEVKLAGLDRLLTEKFGGIALQFQERDTRTTQAAETSQKALDAALLAAAALVNQQNEANATAATVQTLSFTKQIDQIIVLTERQQKSSDDRLAELKERIDRGDGKTTGVTEARVETQTKGANLGMWIGVGIAALIGSVSLILGIVDVMLKLQP